jgi:predicted GTPase
MCPTELLWEPGTQPSIRLLPIETRAEQTSLSTLREDAGAWIEVPLETHDRDSMLQGLARVADTKRVPLTTARLFGLYDEFDPDHAAQVGHDGQIEISCWRHAIINFPHPLLKQGLVVIDTPGLNAIGSEPELTINLIPNADVVLFVLAADTGVTRSDLDTWQRHIGGATRHGRFVLLNKIDTMWDELKSTDEIEAEIDKQIEHSAELLGVDRDQMFALSAQKGLVGKIHHDAPLLARSRLLTLENAISERLVPQRRRIVAEQLAHDVDGVMREIQGMLVGRTRGVVEQIYELYSVRGKNTSSV